VNKARTVLYADDDLDDKIWFNDACKAINSTLEMKFLESGKNVLHYLEKSTPLEYPSLIVLDLNMPELDGRQTLKALKSNPTFKHIPVAIVTTSSSYIDKEVCRRLGASLFLIKPNTHSEWQNIVRDLEPYV
jgi:two-component system, response regulator